MYWLSIYLSVYLSQIPFRNSEMLGLHCIDVSSYDCCYQMSDLRLKCTKFHIGWGSDPDFAGKAYSVPKPLAGFKGLTSKGRQGSGVARNFRQGVR